MSHLKNYYKATIIEIADEFAVIKIFDDQEIKWHKNRLPDNLKEGDTFYLTAQEEVLSNSSGSSQDAINLLEEILNGETEKKA